MDITTFLVVILAAFLHSSWNLFVKKGRDQFRSLSLMAATSGVICLLALPFAPPLDPAAWWFLAASAPLHAGYRIFLSAGYRYGDMSQVYPIARGAIPLFVLPLSLIFVNADVSGVQIGAVLTIALGIMGLTFVRGIPTNYHAVGFALVTAAFVACFTLLDAEGAALGGQAITYILWVFLLEGLLMLLAGLVAGPRAFLAYTAENWKICTASGFVMSLAHALIIWALSRSEVALVSALREVSVVMTMIFGSLVLRERLGLQKAACTILVLFGIAAIALN
ncbi:EamA family transporter [Aureimonas altamirensis]|uniref:EamA family transporter n=1 Tax=Aureimonas altamirensis TaxID=370622 RepID=UPI002037305A|nr:EamA family transporter [Aureimonas altamirensis]MCM2505616.1 EamA family transporter [Aureimonas altamirensis]